MLSLDLNKTLPLIFLPLGSTLLLASALVRSRHRVATAALLVILGVASAPVAADNLLRLLEDQYPYVSVPQCPPADAAFVFGGMLGPRDRMDGGIAWNDAAERFDRALRILKAGKTNLIVFSGGADRYEGGPDEGELLKQEALDRGARTDQLMITKSTWNTRSEADQICQLAHSKQWKRILIVTSAYHMLRAMRLTEPCTVERVAIPVAYQTAAPNTSWTESRLENYLPQAKGLSHSELALREYLGVAFYRAGHFR